MADKNVDDKIPGNMQYDITITMKGNKFVLFINELGIIESDESLEKAYNKVEAEVKKYIQKMKEYGLDKEIISPKALSSKNGKQGLLVFLKENIAAFMIKLLIVCFVAVIALSFAADKVENFIAARAEAAMARIEAGISSRITNLNVEEFIKVKVKDLYDRINNMPDEKIEEKRLKLKTVIQKIKPLLDEFKAISGDKEAAGEKNSAGNAY